MKEIKIKRIRLVNFKGVRAFEMEFDTAGITSIYGRNASGKTTIFDAFTWLLFGKNSEDKKQFGIKTVDGNGNVIQRLPHEVSAVIEVDGQEITLTRTLNEKWQKKRGTAEEEFKGNEETRLYNEVPLSVRDWQAKIDAICTEDTFKMVTNPLYFTSLKWDKQREMLIRMAGDVTTDDVVATNPEEFGKLISDMTGKTFEEYKKEIGAKKRRIKEEVETLPSRIDERKRDAMQQYDWNLIEARLHHKEKKLAEVDAQIADRSQLTLKMHDSALREAEEYIDLQMDIARKRSDISQNIRMKEFEAEHKLDTQKAELTATEERMERGGKVIADLQAQLMQLKSQRETLIAEWRSIKAETLQMSEDDFVCPTCGHPFDLDKIEQKQQEMTARFNAHKAQRLEDNKRRGLQVKSSIERIESQIAAEANKVETMRTRKAELEQTIATNKPHILTDEQIEEIIKNDPEIARKEARLAAMTKPEETPAATQTDEAVEQLKAERTQLREEIAQMREQLALKAVSEQNAQRIAELEKLLREQSDELARLEGIEFTIQQFTKTRISMLEGKINSMFGFVKFKMFDQQINGGEVETCKAIVNGVVYDDLNNAMKINAGLDIINAICRFIGICAPCFVDNAEAVNELIKTQSQVIRLVVSDDNELKIA